MEEVDRLLQVTLYVTDVERSARFYAAVGLRVYPIEEPPYPRHSEGWIADTALTLWPAVERATGHIRLGLRVGSIDAVAIRLDEIDMPYERSRRFLLHTTDPDGNGVHLVQRTKSSATQ